MRIGLLGGFTVEVGGRTIPDSEWRLRRARTLVKVLALAAGHQQHREHLLDLLWPERDPAPAVNGLHQVLHASRRALSSTGAVGHRLLELHGDLVRLHGEGSLHVDADMFTRCATHALHTGDAGDVRAALHAYGGELLPEDRYEHWAAAPREEIAGLHRALLVAHADGLARSGNETAAVTALEEVLGGDPLHEPALRALMAVLAATGRRAEALARYERLRDGLRASYGSDPDPQTRRLFRDLLAGSVDVPGSPPPARPRQRGAPRHNLPQSLTSFVGRGRELKDMQRLLSRTRILTLTGPGGAGKTRLAEELGRRVAADYGDGVWLADLAPVADTRLVPDMVAVAMGLPPGVSGDPARALAVQAGTMHTLVVLDNCDLLLSACAHLVTTLLRRCPRLTVMATSREPLHVPGEITFRVPSLEVPGEVTAPGAPLARVSSVRLFCDRARQARPDVTVDAAAQQAVATICRRLDGMPLAVELAAARVAHMPVQQIAERVGDALSVLGRGPRVVTRHATLRAALDWSHGLLAGDERVLFRRLAVFAGGFSLGAAEGVCPGGLLGRAGVVDCLGRLVDKSLVQAETSGHEVRYRLLETMRQFAREQLAAAGEAVLIGGAHCDHYLALAAGHDPEQARGLIDEQPRVLDADHDNLRAALSWALEHDPARALRLAARLWRFWLARGHFAEGQDWLERVLQAAPEPAADRSRALTALGAFDCRRGRTDRLAALADESVAVLRGSSGDEHLMARLLRGFLVFLTFDLDRAEQIGREIGAQADVRGHRPAGAGATWLRALVALCREDVAAALALLGECEERVAGIHPRTRPFFPALTVCMPLIPVAGRMVPAFEETLLLGRRVGAEQAAGYLLSARGYAARFAADYGAARASVSEAAGVFRALGDRTGLAVALNHLGCIARDRGDTVAAECELQEALRLRRDLGDRRGEHLTSCNLGLLAAATGDTRRARRIVAEALAGSRAIGDGPWTGGSLLALGIVDLHRGDRVSALVQVERALDALTPQGWGRLEAWPRLVAAELATELAEPDRARRHRDRAGRLFAPLGCRIAAQRLSRLQAGPAARSAGPHGAARVLPEAVKNLLRGCS